MKISDLFNLAQKSLRSNLLRSILTSLGIIIGVSSVITMISIGSGAKEEVTNLIDKFVGSGPLGGVISALRGELDLGFLGQNDTVYSCELIQAFPTTLGQIQLGDGNADGIVELSVQLSYKNWRSSANRGKPFGFNVSSLIGSSAAAGAISKIKSFL